MKKTALLFLLAILAGLVFLLAGCSSNESASTTAKSDSGKTTGVSQTDKTSGETAKESGDEGRYLVVRAVYENHPSDGREQAYTTEAVYERDECGNLLEYKKYRTRETYSVRDGKIETETTVSDDREFRYSEYGGETEERHIRWNGDEKTVSRIETIEYDDYGRRIGEKAETYDWQTGEYRLSNTIKYSYDGMSAYESSRAQESFNIADGSLQYARYEDYTYYDEKGNILTQTYANENHELTEAQYFYNEDGKRILYISESENGSVRTEWSYNELGKISDSTTTSTTSGRTKATEKQYNYDEAGNQVSVVSYTDGVLSEETRSEYDDSGNCTYKEATYRMDGTGGSIFHDHISISSRADAVKVQTTSTYDENGCLSSTSFYITELDEIAPGVLSIANVYLDASITYEYAYYTKANPPSPIRNIHMPFGYTVPTIGEME